jgi:polyvinyl alcohol dehydrogenase (cytochrome)
MTWSFRISWAAALAGLALSTAAGAAEWPSAGRDLANSRYQSGETQISSRSVQNLQLKWTVATDGDVTANPAVDGHFLYFPDSAGFLYKVNKGNGALVWKKPVSGYTGITGDFARATPAVSGDALILGNQAGKMIAPDFSSFGAPDAARVFAVNKHTGNLMWMTKVDPGLTMSMVTHSAIVAKGLAIVGVASNEELIAGFVPKAFGWQWHFRGSVVALDVATGAIKWKTYTVPPGYYGGAVWGSTGAVDLKRKQVYMATGNNYMVPQPVLDCLNARGTPAACLSPADHFDSIIAFDLDTGAIKWASKGLSYDAWNVGCGLNIPGVFQIFPNDNCPVPAGPDWDFAQGPLLFGGGNDNDRDDDKDRDDDGNKEGGRDLVGAGQKSGMFWAFRADNGRLAWSTQAAPPGLTGGLQWGSATNGKRIWFAASNSGLTGAGTTPLPWKQSDGSTTTAGGWGMLNANSGTTMWTRKDPYGDRAEAAVSGANGVMFGCSLAGNMYALDARKGDVLWTYNSGARCNAGPSIADGMVFWGSGTFAGDGKKKVFAFGF